MEGEHETLERVAALLATRNQVDAELAAVIDRPMAAGHLGEWLAASVFGLELEQSATVPGIDGVLRVGPLSGSTVNVKWYLKREGLLDLTIPGPDLYLVFAGPRAAAASSRGQLRPWCIETVHLFEAASLLEAQRSRGAKIGTASSVPAALWDSAEIYPRSYSALLTVTDQQHAALGRFSLAALTRGAS